ncbi:MAG: hypothetical protein ACK511_15070 [Burkholderiales bacterium]|jgi:hypothetical protein|nr:hypothetical protein [Betaproteobacteria bacterium]
MKQFTITVAVLYFSLISVHAISQTTASSKTAGGYTPQPVSTTYRPLIGKLFFTDTERDRLDKARKDGVLVVDGEVVARTPRVDGFVKSSSGRTTYWVDGGQRIDSTPSNNIAARPSMTGTESAVKIRETGVSPTRPAVSESVSANNPKPSRPNPTARKQP